MDQRGVPAGGRRLSGAMNEKRRMSDLAIKAQESELLDYLLSPNFDAPRLNAFAELAEKIRVEWPFPARIDLAERWRKQPPSADTVRLYSLLFHLSGDLYYLERSVQYCDLDSDRADPEFLHYIYWCIMRQMFLGRAEPSKASFGPCDLFRLYECLLALIETHWSPGPRATPKRAATMRPRVCFITNQFLGQRHQPSRDCSDFAMRLQTAHGADVAVVGVEDAAAVVAPSLAAIRCRLWRRNAAHSRCLPARRYSPSSATGSITRCRRPSSRCWNVCWIKSRRLSWFSSAA